MEKYGEEFILKRHVYKPYHPWRYGFRREKIHAWLIRCLRMLLVVEGMILSMRYLEEHKTTQLYEREIPYEVEAENVYGIGFDTDKGNLFWFQKKSQMKQE